MTSSATMASSTTSPVDERLRDAVRQRCRGWLREHADDISQATQLRLLARVRARPQAATAACAGYYWSNRGINAASRSVSRLTTA